MVAVQNVCFRSRPRGRLHALWRAGLSSRVLVAHLPLRLRACGHSVGSCSPLTAQSKGLSYRWSGLTPGASISHAQSTLRGRLDRRHPAHFAGWAR